MSSSKSSPTQTGHTVPSMKSPKDRGVPHLARSLNDEGTLRVEIDGDWTSLEKATNATEVTHWIVMQLVALGETGQRIS
jgi:hypothetical protein